MKSNEKLLAKWAIVGAVAVIFLVGVVGFAKYGDKILGQKSLTSAIATGESREFDFSQVSSDGLSAKQLKLLAILEQEYISQPDMIKYSEGVREPWCADFVSWAMREIDAPLANPNSGSWRIPGVYTLNDYLISRNAFHKTGDGYVPKFGDIVTYDGGKFGVHTNFVLRNEDGVLTTVGGNENHRILVQQYDMNDARFGATGFGEFAVLAKSE